MKHTIAFLLLTLGSFTAFAQDQMAIRINERGILKVLKSALKYNASGDKTSFKVPSNLYKFTLKKSQLLSNPVIPVINQVSNLDLNRDLDFYLSTSDIRISGAVNPKSLKAVILRSSPTGFDFQVSLTFTQVIVTAENLSLCENKIRNQKKCGSGLKASLKKLRILTQHKPVTLSAVFRLLSRNGEASVKVLSVKSNLETRQAPGLNINFASVTIPPISLIVNDVETVLDTSELKSEILKRKAFLAQKLMTFVADFVTSDLAEMVNVYLSRKKVATTWEAENFYKTFDENGEELTPVDEEEEEDALYLKNFDELEAADPMTTLMNRFADIIHRSKVKVSLTKISTPKNKDIELTGAMELMLNGRSMKVQNSLGNSGRKLPPLNLANLGTADINLAISEPLINGALDLVNSTGLFQKIFEQTARVQGFTIRNVKAHFTKQNTITAVANSSIDLKQITSDGLSDWIQNMVAAILERNNNNSVIYFPLDIEIIPQFHKLPSGEVELRLMVLSPFENEGLSNDFHYPTNVDRMYEVVRAGVMKKLRKNLSVYVDKTYDVDLSRFLNQSGVTFVPTMISVDQSAYLMMNLDLADIKFTSLHPLAR